MNRSLYLVCALLAGSFIAPGATIAHARQRQTKARIKARIKARTRVRVSPESAHRKVLRTIRQSKGSVSLGNTSTGHLIRAAQLPQHGKHHAVLRRCRTRRTNYGTDELVALMKYAAGRVARAYPGSRMILGNLSLKRGGDIQWSQSHNAGRDGDIVFFLKRGRRTLVPKTMVKIDARLRSVRSAAVRFDLRRNWALIKALLTHKTIRVQWIFIAKYLKAGLIKYGRAHRESAALLARVDKILRQPTDSLSHDDHFHVRIYCSRGDRLQGCVDRAPFWKGIPTHDLEVAKRIRILQKGMKDPEASVRLEIIAQLVRLQARQAAAEVARRGLRDPDPKVRRAALGAILVWRNKDRAVISALSSLIQRPGNGVLRGDAKFERPKRGQPDLIRTGRQLRLAYDALARLGCRQSVPLLRRALASKRSILNRRGLPALPEPLLAASAARSVLDLRLVPALLKALEHPSGAVRRIVAGSLRRLTNHSRGVVWGRRLSKRQRRRQMQRWQRWWRKHRTQSREALVRQGFRRVNRRLRNLKTRRAQRLLVSYTRRKDRLGFNAHRMLRVLSGQRWRSHDPGNIGRRHQRWVRWYRRKWRRRRRRPRRRRHRRPPRIRRKQR
jgi:murein endopeptidase